MKRIYTNRRTTEKTDRASIALQWHNNGDSVGVIYNGVDGFVTRYSIISGAKVETEKRDENFEYCKRIATELEAYENGNIYRCPECGEETELPDGVGDKYKCPHCGEVSEVDDLEQLSLYDYFEDILDIEYLVNSEKEYKACKICVTWGGPSVYIDTESRAVELYWWGQRASYSLLSSTVDAIDEWAEEYFNYI